MATSVFRVELTMKVAPSRKAEFEQTWLEVGETVAGHPDNIAQWLSVDCEAEGTYVIVSDWPDETTFRRFEATPEHRELTKTLRSLRTSGSMTTMQVLHHLRGAGGQ